MVHDLVPSRGCILVDERSWVLFDDYQRMRSFQSLNDRTVFDEAFVKNCVSESYLTFISMQPQECIADKWGKVEWGEAVTQVAEWRTESPPSILGVPVTRYSTGYSFCLGRIDRHETLPRRIGAERN